MMSKTKAELEEKIRELELLCIHRTLDREEAEDNAVDNLVANAVFEGRNTEFQLIHFIEDNFEIKRSKS